MKQTDKIVFHERTDTPEKFFGILPDDWRESIEPHWREYESNARIFTLELKKEAVAGGIVFYTVSPDTLNYKEEAQSWFDRDYLYFGYLWVPEKHRGKGLGSEWLRNLKARFPKQKFWLAIEAFGLSQFYQLNGFEFIKKVKNEEIDEWILVSRDAN